MENEESDIVNTLHCQNIGRDSCEQMLSDHVLQC